MDMYVIRTITKEFAKEKGFSLGNIIEERYVANGEYIEISYISDYVDEPIIAKISKVPNKIGVFTLNIELKVPILDEHDTYMFSMPMFTYKKYKKSKNFYLNFDIKKGGWYYE